jgi:hypothetical protein
MRNQFYIPVPVPEDLLPNVLEYVAGLMRSRPPEPPPAAPGAAISPINTPNRPSGGRGNGDKSWPEEELRKAWLESGPHMRTTLELLARQEGAPVSGDRIAAALGRKERGHTVAGMMGAFGRRMKGRHGGRWPFTAEWNATSAHWDYRMDIENAARLLRVLADLQPN